MLFYKTREFSRNKGRISFVLLCAGGVSSTKTLEIVKIAVCTVYVLPVPVCGDLEASMKHPRHGMKSQIPAQAVTRSRRCKFSAKVVKRG